MGVGKGVEVGRRGSGGREEGRGCVEVGRG